MWGEKFSKIRWLSSWDLLSSVLHLGQTASVNSQVWLDEISFTLVQKSAKDIYRWTYILDPELVPINLKWLTCIFQSKGALGFWPHTRVPNIDFVTKCKRTRMQISLCFLPEGILFCLCSKWEFKSNSRSVLVFLLGAAPSFTLPYLARLVLGPAASPWGFLPGRFFVRENSCTKFSGSVFRAWKTLWASSCILRAWIPNYMEIDGENWVHLDAIHILYTTRTIFQVYLSIKYGGRWIEMHCIVANQKHIMLYTTPRNDNQLVIL